MEYCIHKLCFAWGKVKPDLLMKVAGSYRSRKNACRDLTSLIKRTPGATLKLPIEVFKIHIRLRKPVRCVEAWWPVLTMSSWCKFFVQSKPQLLLAGCRVDQDWMRVFRSFWADYRLICPNHPVFTSVESMSQLGSCVPYYIHGDEGQGHNKRPYLVLSWQTAIGFKGLESCNDTSILGCGIA